MGHDESICRRLEDLLRRLEMLAQPAGASGQPGHCMKVSEAARLVGISKSAIYGAIRRGELRVVRLGRSRRIRAAELDAWVADHETPAL